jgi:hypothetical protein
MEVLQALTFSVDPMGNKAAGDGRSNPNGARDGQMPLSKSSVDHPGAPTALGSVTSHLGLRRDT